MTSQPIDAATAAPAREAIVAIALLAAAELMFIGALLGCGLVLRGGDAVAFDASLGAIVARPRMWLILTGVAALLQAVIAAWQRHRLPSSVVAVLLAACPCALAVAVAIGGGLDPAGAVWLIASVAVGLHHAGVIILLIGRVSAGAARSALCASSGMANLLLAAAPAFMG